MLLFNLHMKVLHVLKYCEYFDTTSLKLPLQSKAPNFVSAHSHFSTGLLWSLSGRAVFLLCITLIKIYNCVLCDSPLLKLLNQNMWFNRHLWIKLCLALIRRHVFGPSKNSMLKQQGHVHVYSLPCSTKQK